MKVPAALRSLILLILGLVIGGAGAVLFQDSIPGAAGSPEERADKLETELKRAKNRIAALEDTDEGRGARPSSPAQTFADGARSIAEDIREGRPVTPDDIFRTTKPLLRDLAPLFDRMRIRQQREVIDSMTGELARKYHLTLPQQTALKGWFEQKAEAEAKRWTEVLAADGTRLEDIIRASRDVQPDEGIDRFMAGILPLEKAVAFRAERMAERAERLQRDADMKVQRIDSIVRLDEAQRDQIFGIMARGSRDYDPAMVLEGAGGEIGLTPPGDVKAAMMATLRPEQRAAYEAEQLRRREAAQKDAQAIGLTLPADWEMLTESF